MSNTKFLDLLGLTRYDSKIKTYIGNGLSTKQDTLVSGTNIKTINGTSILGSGDITISGGNQHLYRHKILVNDTDHEVMYCFQVINASNTAFTLSSFFTYLENNYIVGLVADYNSNSISNYQCNGGYDEENDSVIRYSGDTINRLTPGLSFNDTIETIF